MMLMHDYYKYQLEPQAIQIYDALVANISKLASSGVIDIPICNHGEILRHASAAYRALRMDRPEYYFLGHSIQIRYCTSGVLTIQHDLKFSTNHIICMNNILKNIISKLTEGIKGLPQVEKEKRIYQRVGRMFTYKEGAYSHDLSGLIVFKDGVCESIAGILVVAFREVGIPAIVVQGYAHNEGHRWCKVWINNFEYFVDVTWDMINCKRGLRLKYFNLSYEQMEKDHHMIENIVYLKRL